MTGESSADAHDGWAARLGGRVWSVSRRPGASLRSSAGHPSLRGRGEPIKGGGLAAEPDREMHVAVGPLKS